MIHVSYSFAAKTEAGVFINDALPKGMCILTIDILDRFCMTLYQYKAIACT